jgi:NAD(P)-dependent dehydrogenase (short-subunit alcohol dehydrogenase family)
MTVRDKAVLVTGANRGLGQALVPEALARGARRVYAGAREPLAHPDDRVTPLRLNALVAGQGGRVHAVLAGLVDTDMTRGASVPMPSAESVAVAIFDAVENGEEEIFPIPPRRP